MKQLLLYGALIFTLVSHSVANATTSEAFSLVWEMIRADHPELKSANEELGAASSALERSKRHWLPRLSASVSAYQTNDAAQNFFGNLGQRSVTANDFNAATLNLPGSHSFAQFSLSGELPIYEGGTSTSYAQIQKLNFQAKQYLNSAAAIEVYAQSVELYSRLLNAKQSQESLNELKAKVDTVLAHYSLGSKSNPIGYSGLLGLRSVMNRIVASLNFMKLEILNQRTEILERAKKLSSDWSPNLQKVDDFLDITLPLEALRSMEDSPSVAAQLLGSDIQNEKVSIERSKFLPQFGLFAESNYLLGARNSGTAYTGGLYFRWSVFNPKEFGMVEESNHLSLASQAKTMGSRIDEKLSREQMLQSLTILNENEKMMQDTSKLMAEQVSTAARLFQSGSLNALQMVEVFNRRADLILQIHELHLQLISNRVHLAKTSRLIGVKL